MSDEDELHAVVLAAVSPAIAEWRRIAETAQAEVGALRKRVAELEALNEAGARAVDALESIGEQARQRIVDLTSWLRYALEHWAPEGSNKAERARALLDRAEAETPALAGNSLGTRADATPDDPAK